MDVGHVSGDTEAMSIPRRAARGNMIEERLPLTQPSGEDPMAALIRRAAEGDRQAMRQLVTTLTPCIRTAVVSALARSTSPARRAARQEVEDVTQSVLLALFADRGRVLQQWDPTRRIPLEAFVALLAKHETHSILRSRRRSPWTEDPTLNEDLDRNAVARMGPESEAISRDMLDSLAEAVRSRLTPKGNEVFDLLFIRGLPAEEVSATTGLSMEAVYAWKSRLTRQVKEILADLAQVPPSAPPAALNDSYPGVRDPTLETLVRVRRAGPAALPPSAPLTPRNPDQGGPPPPGPGSAPQTPPQGAHRLPRRRGGAA
jgi:RNA polymerase sigma-70 factor (ECF subfamily)